MKAEPLDVRLAPLALAAWGAAATGVGWPVGRALLGATILLVLAVAVALVGSRARRLAPRSAVTPVALVGIFVVGAAALAIGGLHSGSVQAGPVPELARIRAQVQVTATVVSDPVERPGDFGPYVMVRLRAVQVSARGVVTAVRSPILVIGDTSWSRARYADTIRASGRLQPADGVDLSAVMIARGPPDRGAAGGSIYQAISHVREGLTEAASVLPPAERSLVPALVDGDDSKMPVEVAAEFQTTGLTHLLAVSGANLTLMLGFLLLVARWASVRARGLVILGVVGVVFFVLLARPQPSVLRAAAMGVVALAGLSSAGSRRGVRLLCVAVVGLVLVDPQLSRSIGFLLSTVATAGILVLAPQWRDCLARWMPRPLAEAVAVPLAAQLACTPAIAAISGQVSLVAVFSNLVAAPAVGPTTVVGLVGGMVALVNDPVSHLVGYAAGASAWWIVWVADRGASLSGASLPWPAGAVGVAALSIVCLGLVVVMPTLLSRRWSCLAATVVLVMAVVQPIGRAGWPPHDWLLVMCDVGQGDAMVLNAGGGVGVVVDAGPDPTLVDGCLDRLGVDRVALVVLTHFHADHVDGLPGLLAGRTVGEIEVSPLADSPDRAESVSRWAAKADVPVTVAVTGERRTVGDLSWQVLGPVEVPTGDEPAGGAQEGSAPNNASIVMLVEVRGVRLLMSGDAEPEEEDDILASTAGLGVDVFKVAHHGSANQDPDFVRETGARVAIVSVGADNDYGHPAPETLALLQQLGARVYRTDRDGDIAVLVRAGQLLVVTWR